MGASLRTITASAGVNLAGVNYYFRTKEVFLQEVLSRRLRPINRRRLKLLEAADAATSGAAVPVERIVEAFVPPLLGHEQWRLRRLIGRVHAEPAECGQRVFAVECWSVPQRFTSALERALSGLSPNEAAIRLQFAIGFLVQISAGVRHQEMRFSEASTTGVLGQMVSFITAGLKAPATKCVAAGLSPG